MAEAQIFGLFCAAAVLAVLLFKPVRAWLRDRRRTRQNRAAISRWAAENPPGPPMPPDEIAAFHAWFESSRLPAVLLDPAGPAVAAASGTRISGPVCLAEDESWPTDRGGKPMEFLAQIDFGEIPALPDFPDSGILQFFVANDDLFGADFDDPRNCDIRLIWRPEPVTAASPIPPPPFDIQTDVTPLYDEARTTGVAVTFTPVSMPPHPEDWTVDERLGHRDTGDLDDRVEGAGAPFRGRHHVGGYPEFTQWDFRASDKFADYDRVLLKLTSDETMIWGDVGEAAFLIRRGDLLARNFGEVIFWWDCT